MLSGHVTASATSDGVVNRRPRRLFGRSSERKSPLNVQFERQVARLESRQQQQRCIIFTVIPLNFCCDFKPSLRVENGNNHPSSEPTSPEDSLCSSSSSPSSPPIILLHLNAPDEPHKICPDNPSRLLTEKSTASDMSNSDFLVNSFTKASVNATHTARRKSKKKSKKHRQRCRKPTDGSETNCRESNNSAPSIDMVDCEGLTLSPKHVGDIVFEDTFSPSSSVKEASEEPPDSENDNEYHVCSVTSGSGASYCDETELSRPTTSCLELFGQCNSSNFRYLDNTPKSMFMDSSQETCYASRSGNCSDDSKTMLIFRNECGPNPCETTEFCGSSDGFDENWLEKSNHGSGLCSQSCVGTCNGVQAVHLCSDASSDSDFHLVISRKRARKEKKMSLWKTFNGECASTVTHGRNEKYAGRSSRQMIKELNTEDFFHRQSHVGSIHPPQHGVALKHSTNNFVRKPSNVCVEPQNGSPSKDSKLGTSRNRFTSPKENRSEKSNSDFNKKQNIDLNKKVSNAGHSRESNCCEMRSNSASEPTTPKSAKGNCTSESVKSTYYTVGALPMQKRGLQASLRVYCVNDTSSGLPSPDSKCTRTDLVVRSGAVPSVEGNHNFRKCCSPKMHLIEMIKVVNDAYEVQVAADVHLAAGYPITDLETFIYSATPVIGHVPCMKISNCSRDELVSNSVCQQHISNVSLRSIWEWYEEPGCYGLEVRVLNDLSSKTSRCNSSEFYAYFVPYLSAIQLFGWSTKNMGSSFGVEEEDLLEASNTASFLSSHPVPAKLHQPFEQSNSCFSESSLSEKDHGELIFEYFETEQPSFRPPLFEKIKELISGVNVSGHRIVGDPEKLQNVKLCDLHPASWFVPDLDVFSPVPPELLVLFCVAWYPVYRVPHGNLRAAFLTYHSLGKLVPQKCSPDLTGQHTRIVSPVVGLESYNDKGERWLQPRCPDFKQLPINESSKPSHAEVLKERLRTLKRGALAMARAVILKGTGESVNHHPDYEFFLSRSA